MRKASRRVCLSVVCLSSEGPVERIRQQNRGAGKASDRRQNGIRESAGKKASREEHLTRPSDRSHEMYYNPSRRRLKRRSDRPAYQQQPTYSNRPVTSGKIYPVRRRARKPKSYTPHVVLFLAILA